MVETPTHAISIRQPWADAILFRGKDIENRTWTLADRWLGQALWLHAGKTMDHSWADWFQEDSGLYVPTDRTGVILGTVTFSRCITWDDIEAGRADDTRWMRWMDGPIGWVIEDRTALDEPIPYPGRLGIFPVDIPTA